MAKSIFVQMNRTFTVCIFGSENEHEEKRFRCMVHLDTNRQKSEVDLGLGLVSVLPSIVRVETSGLDRLYWLHY